MGRQNSSEPIASENFFALFLPFPLDMMFRPLNWDMPSGPLATRYTSGKISDRALEPLIHVSAEGIGGMPAGPLGCASGKIFS